MKKIWFIVAIIALFLGIGARYIIEQPEPEMAKLPQAALGQLSSNGQPVNLYNQDDSRLRVVYFGYSHCPDVCPTSLAILSAALNQLPPETLQQLWPIFITLDPERDTSEKSQEYANYFHPNITGMTGTMQQTNQLAATYGVLFAKAELKDSAMEYSVDHNSYFYFLKPDGTLVEKVPHTLDPAPIIEVVNNQLSSQGEP
ncbi:SCO family protein [Aliivibrio kagoshimensis]|uniref:SCO family protein n=1 Tax=Aliivibrio kagoshimensis TaxID=2910230 RepID=UPI003D12ECCA